MRSKSSQRSSGGNDDGDVSIERDAGPRSGFEFGFLMTLADIDVLKSRGSSAVSYIALLRGETSATP